MTINEITGDRICSGNRKEDDQKYRDNYERLYGKRCIKCRKSLDKCQCERGNKQ